MNPHPNSPARKKLWRLLLAPLALVLCASTLVQAQQRLTVFVKCDADGQIAQPHKVEVTVEQTTPSGVKEISVSLEFPQDTSSKAIADAIAEALRRKGVAGAKSEETTGPHSHYCAEDVVLPPGTELKKKRGIRVWLYSGGRWKPKKNRGHLQIIPYVHEGMNGNALQSFTIDFDDADTPWLGVSLFVEGVLPNGDQYEFVFDQRFDVWYSIEAVLMLLAQELQLAGLPAELVSATELTVSLGETGLMDVRAGFQASVSPPDAEADDDGGDDGQDDAIILYSTAYGIEGN